MNSREKAEITNKMPVESYQGYFIFFDAYRSEMWKICKSGTPVQDAKRIRNSRKNRIKS